MTREKRCKRNPDRPECQKLTTTKAELHDSFEDLFKDLGNTINIMTDSIDTTESPVEENENQTSNPGVTTTVYNNLNIKNNKILRVILWEVDADPFSNGPKPSTLP